MALQQAPQLRIAESAALTAEAQRREARSSLLPSLDLNAGYSSDSSEILSVPSGSSYSGIPGTTSDYTSKSYSLNLSQPLYNGQALAYYQAAKDVQAQQQALYSAARQQLMVQVTQAYFAVLQAQHSLSLTRAERTALEQQLEEMRQRFKVGLSTRTEVHETQARYDLSVADVLQAEQQLDTSRELLAELIGRAPDKLDKVADNLVLYKPEPDNIDQWEQRALDHHPEYQASKQAVAAASESLKAEKRAYLPSLNLAADYNYLDTGGSSGREANSTSVGVQFNLPIYSGGSTSARVAQARAQLQQARAQEEQVRRKISRQVRSAFIKLKSDINRVKALSRALLSQQQALDATEVGLKVGARSNIDLLNARRDLLSAKRDYAQARYDYLVTSLELYRAAGTLDEARLAQVNGWMK
jgi:outer membrane protein